MTHWKSNSNTSDRFTISSTRIIIGYNNPTNLDMRYNGPNR
eukprot:CAMPEP_0197059762 /NCGR_PEP_ID=MMETSP1384-20130603/120735_1 /TAXON_ID=29189 /ORGANISM="Ammonia sp." /LENGTH=40 /DNA_ID= /DNA_START= /DNA_END= /DNA_ORIENTATION=